MVYSDLWLSFDGLGPTSLSFWQPCGFQNQAHGRHLSVAAGFEDEVTTRAPHGGARVRCGRPRLQLAASMCGRTFGRQNLGEWWELSSLSWERELQLGKKKTMELHNGVTGTPLEGKAHAVFGRSSWTCERRTAGRSNWALRRAETGPTTFSSFGLGFPLSPAMVHHGSCAGKTIL